MTLDNEQQRAFLLDLFNAVQIPGQHLAVAYEIRIAIERATLGTGKNPSPAQPISGGVVNVSKHAAMDSAGESDL